MKRNRIRVQEENSAPPTRKQQPKLNSEGTSKPTVLSELLDGSIPDRLSDDLWSLANSITRLEAFHGLLQSEIDTMIRALDKALEAQGMRRSRSNMFFAGLDLLGDKLTSDVREAFEAIYEQLAPDSQQITQRGAK